MYQVRWGIRKARVWLNELPDWSYTVARVHEKRQAVQGYYPERQGFVAVELYVPVDGRAHYAGLGATFLPQQITELLIRVQTTATQSGIWSNAFTSQLASPGLPDIYGEAILASIAHLAEHQRLGTGTLTFWRAVYNDEESSSWFFQLLAHVVLRLLVTDQHTLTEKNVLDILRFTLAQYKLNKLIL